MSVIVNNPRSGNVEFNIQDTEILIRTLQGATIPGSEAKSLSEVLDKVYVIHKALIAKKVTI